MCDGNSHSYGDCSDGSDESYCMDYVCPDAKWKCLDGVTCIPKSNVCGGTSHCPDSSDEDPSVCQNWTCPPGYWKCHDQTKCIRESSYVLDGNSDCKDGSDEIVEYLIKSSCEEGKQLCNKKKINNLNQ